ncbi:MAG: VCBS repeat-containing protein, partial [Bacteroidota bacterium]
MIPYRHFFLLGLALLWSPLFSQSFTEVAPTAGIQHVARNNAQMGTGLAWFDYDADGDEDLYAVGGLAGSALYRNNGDGTFTDVTAGSGIVVPDSNFTQGVVTGDIDNDGYRDIYISTLWNLPNYLFHNNGDGTFTNITMSSGIGADSLWVSSAAFGDFNLDGLLDLYTGGYVWFPALTYDSGGVPNGYAHRCMPNQLYLNNGNLTFTDVAGTYMVGDTGCALSVVFTDFDRDHDQDIFIANDFGEWVYPNGLYENSDPHAIHFRIHIRRRTDFRIWIWIA